ncbi:hypothetical protein HF086_014281 [Spodoptera exigua]|uniref:Nuclear receptor domain-containing protein n=1 Tax=Spodoptera exigua TaxID=7107 RepID=A0A922M7H7_SPOEX|nr:hypothetical protein HF086_014281 [Spodoptera exigua]
MIAADRDKKIEVQYFCPICGDVTSGLHYGVRTCESCKLFFKRTVQLEKENSYTCAGGRACVVTIQTRAWCKLCRFNKCLNAGMKVSMVQKDNHPITSSSWVKTIVYYVPHPTPIRGVVQRNLLASCTRIPGQVCTLMGYKCGDQNLIRQGILPRYSWSRHGNAIIILGEHRFKKRSKHINQKHETHWVCNKCDKGCKAKLTTLKDVIIKMYNIHDHGGFRKSK